MTETFFRSSALVSLDRETEGETPGVPQTRCVAQTLQADHQEKVFLRLGPVLAAKTRSKKTTRLLAMRSGYVIMQY